MQGMKNQTEAGDFDWADPGRYRVQIVAAEAKLSKRSNNPMISLQATIQGGDFDGISFFHHILTRAGDKGAGFGKKALRQLGVDVDGEADISDEIISKWLLGRTYEVDLNTEPAKDEDGNLKSTIRDGVAIQAMNNRVEAYYSLDGVVLTGQGPRQGQAPQAAAPVQQVAPPAPMQQQAPQAQGAAPVGFAQPPFPQPGQVQAPVANGGQAAPQWVPPPPPPGVAAAPGGQVGVAAPAGGGKRRGKS